jgi:hypothetical protein
MAPKSSPSTSVGGINIESVSTHDNCRMFSFPSGLRNNKIAAKPENSPLAINEALTTSMWYRQPAEKEE